LKIAFIGDSFSAYHQTGQQKNSWTYQLSQQFPQHEYLNYACGGRGYDYYQWALLDAKLYHDVDVIFINRTFSHRVGKLWGDDFFQFDLDQKVEVNYKTYSPNKEIWFSAGFQEKVNIMSKPKIAHPMEKAYLFAMQDESSSKTKQHYNDLWYDNMHKLYNFKHIIKLELLWMNQPDSATMQMYAAHGINRNGTMTHAQEIREVFKAGLIVSESDDHWSKQGNRWALKNYILTEETLDILNKP
tara:strand:- start:3 stop:731 length:729 start_codon:yes stop_codon:yes gene_type:complete